MSTALKSTARVSLVVEQTDIGDQFLVPGVRAITCKDRLEMLVSMPLASAKRQKPCNIGLFDEDARNQMDLFDLVNSTADKP